MFDQSTYRENISWGILDCLKKRDLQGHLTAPLIFGILGGLGIGYSFCDRKTEETVLKIGFRNGWNQKSAFIDKAAERLGVEADILATSSRGKAEAWLDDALQRGPCLVWIDSYYVNYLKVRQICAGCYPRVVEIQERQGDEYLLNDSGFFFTLNREQLGDARMAIRNLKNRIWILDTRTRVDLGRTIRIGLEDCVQNMGSTSRNYAIPTLKKWSKQLTDEKSENGWVTIFSGKEKRYLLDCLIQCFLNINILSDGGGYRYIYGKFLQEAAEILREPDLARLGSDYLRLGGLWRDFSYSALSDQFAPLAGLRALLIDRITEISKQGSQVSSPVDFNQKAKLMMTEATKELEQRDIRPLFAEMSENMYVIFEREKEAMNRLEELIGGSCHGMEASACRNPLS